MVLCGGKRVANVSNWKPVRYFPVQTTAAGRYVSCSTFYNLVNHSEEWPGYYLVVDCRSLREYRKNHVVNAIHWQDAIKDFTAEDLDSVTMVLYSSSKTDQTLINVVNKLNDMDAAIVAYYVLDGSFKEFCATYEVATVNYPRDWNGKPGPLELLPATATTPSVYMIHRNQFFCTSDIISKQNCTRVLNISSRRLTQRKTGPVMLRNVLFDDGNEPFDEAITILTEMIEAKSSKKLGNIVIIDETGWEYSCLLVGWYWHTQGHDIDEICEHLELTYGELDPWYCQVLQAWLTAEE